MDHPRTISRRTQLLWLLLAPVACDEASRQADPQLPSATLTPSASAAPTPKPTASQEPLVTPPQAPPPAAARSIAKAMNGFGLALFREVTAQRPANLSVSPLSLSSALTMTWGGAAGETATEMQKTLRLSGSAAEVLRQVGGLTGDLAKSGPEVTVRVANRLFGEKTYQFEQPYLEKTRAAFGAPLEPLDFVGAAEASRERINGWVAQQTNDRIDKLVPADAIGRDTRLVLANAVFFLGDWEEPFKKESTRPAKFHVSASESKDVPTMHGAGSLRYAESAEHKALELRYKGGELSMVLVAPAAVDGLPALLAKLDEAKVAEIVASLRPETVSVALPKFEIDPGEALELAAPLKKLGMPLAFDRARADFSGIAKPVSPADRLFIDKVFHKAFVRVDEKGTEAAAATAVVMPRAGSAPPANVHEFRADRPFVFAIRHDKTGLVLFIGTVVDPTTKG